MKKLNHYEEDCFEFYEEVKSSKRNSAQDPNYKTRLNSLNDLVEEAFEEYDELFDKNNLEDISSKALTATQENDLDRLYKFDNKRLQDLFRELTTSEFQTVVNTCQNCTINEVDSFDHILPKSIFHEFSVNPKNLFPSCTTCNRKKSETWLKNDQRQFLNLYLDALPKVQYLFVDFEVSDNLFTPIFYLENVNGEIDENLFEIILAHYENLDLLDRFSKNSHQRITELINSINSGIKTLTLESVEEVTLQKISRDKASFGFNYWVAVLQESFISNRTYLDYID